MAARIGSVAFGGLNTGNTGGRAYRPLWCFAISLIIASVSLRMVTNAFRTRATAGFRFRGNVLYALRLRRLYMG